MEKPGRDNFANMSLHGKLTVQKNAKVANTVEWFHLNAKIVQMIYPVEVGRCRGPNQINSVLSRFSWSLRAVHHS